jgi:hypothetical protein
MRKEIKETESAMPVNKTGPGVVSTDSSDPTNPPVSKRKRPLGQILKRKPIESNVKLPVRH